MVPKLTWTQSVPWSLPAIVAQTAGKRRETRRGSSRKMGRKCRYRVLTLGFRFFSSFFASSSTAPRHRFRSSFSCCAFASSQRYLRPIQEIEWTRARSIAFGPRGLEVIGVKRRGNHSFLDRRVLFRFFSFFLEFLFTNTSAINTEQSGWRSKSVDRYLCFPVERYFFDFIYASRLW